MAKRLNYPLNTDTSESETDDEHTDKTYEITQADEKDALSDKLEDLLPKSNGKTSKVNFRAYSFAIFVFLVEPQFLL